LHCLKRGRDTDCSFGGATLTGVALSSTVGGIIVGPPGRVEPLIASGLRRRS
jgi:hypothetical protein